MKLPVYYTSYFSCPQLNTLNFNVKYSISRYSPKNWKGNIIKDLAPNENLLSLIKSGEISFDEFKNNYLAQLEYLYTSGKLEGIMLKIPSQSILICYEKDRNICHRSILLEYLIDNNFADSASSELTLK